MDKCEVSVFSSDITQLVMDSIRSSLATFIYAMDQTIAGLSFVKYVNQLRDSSYRKINIGKYGYFLLNPSALRIGQLNYVKDSFSISLGVSCRPLFSSDPSNHSPCLLHSAGIITNRKPKRCPALPEYRIMIMISSRKSCTTACITKYLK